MPKTARQILALLKAHGFVEVRVNGDHHRFEDGKGTRFPFHTPASRMSYGQERLIAL